MPRIALVGFRPFERDALASYLRLMGARAPAYEPCEAMDTADWLVVDGDQPGYVQQVREAGRTGGAVFVGRAAPAGAAAWLQRPIDPQHLLRELDVLQALGGAPMEVPTVPAALDELLEPRLVGTPGPLQPRSANLLDMPALPTLTPMDEVPHAAPALPPAAVGRAGLPQVPLVQPAPVRPAPQALLLDPQDASLKFLETQLADAGVHSHRARSAAEALALLARVEFSLVVLEADLGDEQGHDGLSLCQHIKRDHVHLGELAPRVLLLSSRPDPVQRVRALLAGSDEYMTKPVLVDDLRRALRRLVPLSGTPQAA